MTFKQHRFPTSRGCFIGAPFGGVAAGAFGDACDWTLVAETNQDERAAETLFLKVRGCRIGLHPVPQIMEEPGTKLSIYPAIDLRARVPFLLRIGYEKDQAPPVSLRRPVTWFLRKGEVGP
jgi:hypothetical protein